MALAADTRLKNPVWRLHLATMHFNIRTLLSAIKDGHMGGPTCTTCYEKKATRKPAKSKAKIASQLPHKELAPFEQFACDWSVCRSCPCIEKETKLRKHLCNVYGE